jgi:methyl-accepting chemotaxis protein
MLNMKLKTKLIGGFLIAGCLTLVVGFIGLYGTSKAGSLAKDMSLSKMLVQREMDHMVWVLKVGDFQKEESMTKLEVEKDPHKCGFGKWYYSDDRKKIEAENPKIVESMKQIEEPHKRLHQSAVTLEEMLQKGKEHRPEAINYYRSETREIVKDVQKLLGDVREKVEQDLRESGKSAEASVAQSKFISLAVMIVGFACALLFGIFLALSIIRPIKKISAGLSEGSDQVANASAQVSVSSQSLAEGASEQAAGIEETSSSIEEMASMTRQNADNANQANTLMIETTKVVDDANRAMGELTESMKEITVASEETAKIIKTIDEIAFQTNLLALNAAVEAARAGEAGAGFAVVSDEVRNLAMRAADAAKNTANLIEGTVKKIKIGSDIVTRTNEAFSKVAAGAKKVGELVGEISAASQEQSQGVEQINKAVTEMDRVVQKNAASAEESASASEEMNAQAEQMREFVAELVAVVEGSGNGAGNTLSHGDGNGRQITAAERRPKTKAMILSDTGGKNRTAGKEMAALKTRGVKPEQVIPMEEGNFKEF